MSGKFSGQFTCVEVGGGIIGLDDLPGGVPVPVHIECWDWQGVSNGWRRIKGAKKFAVGRKWHTSLPSGAKCHICGKEI